MPEARRILVTGATGFIGRRLVAQLATRGRPVRAATRRADAALAAGVEEVRVGELDAATDWSAALRDVDAVVHLAGLAHVVDASDAQSLARYREINALGTAQLARAAAAAGVRRFVFMSSARAHGSRTEGAPFVESAPLAAGDPYGRSKAEAEGALQDIAAGTGLEVVRLRPPLVVGQLERDNFARLARLVRRGLPLPLGAVRNRRSVVYVGNLVDVIERAVDHPAAAGRAFLVADGAPLSTPALVRAIARAMGRSARLVPVPLPLLRAAGALLGRGAEIARLVEDFEVDATALRTALDWTPRYTLEEGLRLTFAEAVPPRAE